MVSQPAGGQSEGDGGKTDGLCDGPIASSLAFKALRKRKMQFFEESVWIWSQLFHDEFQLMYTPLYSRGRQLVSRQ